MTTPTIFLILCVLCGMWNIAISIIIFGALQKRGIPVNFIWLRLMALRYAFQYKEITRTETGKVGQFFYQWIISINLALLFAIVAIINII